MTPIDKPWVTAELKKKYNTYRRDLRLFNRNKTCLTHVNLLRSKKEYKSLAAKLKRQYQRAEGNMFDVIRKLNPKSFYRNFRKKKGQPANIDPDVFYDHFKDIALSTNATVEMTELNDEHIIFEELHCVISENEIINAIKRLKREKSHGIDLLMNEYFIEYKDFLVPVILKLLYRILSSGYFPNRWAKSIIIPALKKGDASDPNNYREISLVSCFCKLFTSILNQRLITWSDNNNVITDAQFGFQPQRGTAEAIFSLSTIIDMSLQKKKRL